jgi:hypothetical protein
MANTEPPGAGQGNGENGVVTTEVPYLLDLLFKHRTRLIQDLLKDKGKAYSGTRPKLRQRVEGYLSEGTVQAHELVDLLDRIAGWGNQHVYLYLAPASQIERWNSEAKARAALRAHGKDQLFNRRLPLVLPVNPVLSSVTWSPRSVRFVWVERREWREHLPGEDYVDGDIEYRAHRIHHARGLVAFDWNLVSGHAALLIQRLPSGENYHDMKTRFEVQLEPFIKVSKFDPLYINAAILSLEKSGEVRHRQLEHSTERGGKISFLSRNRVSGAFDDPALKKAREALGDKLDGCHGNFFLPVPNHREREIHIKLYAKDQRIGIFGECSEQEVRHVLSRVRHHCGQPPRA